MRTILQNLTIIAVVAGSVHWLTGLYAGALRDPLFFDGWILVAGMGLQLLFHVRKKSPKWMFGSSTGWMQVHIYTGFCVVLVFAIHTRLSLPDAGLEWALWALFLLVALSGFIGVILTWLVPMRLEQHGEQLEIEKISPLRAELAQRAAGLALESVGRSGSLTISEFYAGTLHHFFIAPRNFLAHLKSSRRPLKRLLFEVESLEREADITGRKILNELKDLVEAKNKLDFQHSHKAALNAWLFIHVPASYALVVLTILHVAVVYAYRSAVQ